MAGIVISQSACLSKSQNYGFEKNWDFAFEKCHKPGGILKVVKASDGSVYEAANHFDMWGIRKSGSPEGVKAVNISISEFLPSGRAKLTVSDKERIYYVICGSIMVAEEDGMANQINSEDMIYILPREKRSMSVNGDLAV
jgi:rhodanese-related sulfurtransferase